MPTGGRESRKIWVRRGGQQQFVEWVLSAAKPSNIEKGGTNICGSRTPCVNRGWAHLLHSALASMLWLPVDACLTQVRVMSARKD